MLSVKFSSGQRYEAEYQNELAFRMTCFMLIDEWMASRIISYLTRLKYAPNKVEYSNREEATSGLADFHAGPLSWWNWNLEMLIFFPGTWTIALGARREPTTNSTHKWHRARIELGTHWWEASVLTTAPSLLPYDRTEIV